MNQFDQVAAAVKEAEQLQQAVRRHAREMATMLVGNLRKSNIPGYVLRQLKEELKGFNMQTYNWS